jgi:hypothetical protein
VVKASRELEKAQQRYDSARAEWEQAASERAAAEAETMAGSREVTVGGDLRTIRPAGALERIATIREREAAAKEAMDSAGVELVNARQAAAASTAA